MRRFMRVSFIVPDAVNKHVEPLLKHRRIRRTVYLGTASQDWRIIPFRKRRKDIRDAKRGIEETARQTQAPNICRDHREAQIDGDGLP
jgi:hypothetical protein